MLIASLGLLCAYWFVIRHLKKIGSKQGVASKDSVYITFNNSVSLILILLKTKILKSYDRQTAARFGRVNEQQG